MIHRLILLLASLGILQLQPTVITGLVMPHHDLARPAIIESLNKFPKDADYEVIVVMSPNHFRPNSYAFSSSTKLLEFEIDDQLVKKITEYDPKMVLDQKLLEGDHGVVVPMTYLHEKWPEARFVPILFSPFNTPEELAGLANFLAGQMPKKTLFVASVDFSHNNQMTAALENNQQSIKAIAGFDYQKLQTFGDEHMDSPAAMATLLHVMAERKTTAWETWQSLHGAEILDNPQLQGTSYVIGVFR